MPKVPTYDRFQATPNTLPQAFAQTPNTHPELAGRQAHEIGQGLTSAGDALGKIAQDMMVETNQTRLDDASLQLREAARKLQFGQQTQSGQQDPGTPVGYAQLKGKDALERPNGQPLSEEYGSLLQEHVSKIGDSLGNDAQKAAFAHYAGGFTNGFKDNIWQHAFQEQRTYNVSVADGLKTEAIENLKSNYRNPGAAEEAITTVLQQTNRIGKLKGLSVPEIDASAKKEVSGALQVGIAAFLAEGDPEGAHNFYNQFSQHMTMDDALPVKAKITAAGDNKIGLAHGQAAFSQAIPAAPAQMAFGAMVGDVFSKGIVQTESGGNQFDANGKPLQHVNGNGTSDFGKAQVNENTAPEAAKLAGLPWDEHKYKNDPDYNHALGLAFFQEQYRVHGNDLTKAVAAYNAPKATADAVKEAAKKGNEDKTWFDFLRPDVQNYVNTSVANYNKAASKPKPEMTMADVEPHLASQNLSPERLKIARNEAEYHIKTYNAQIKQQGERGLAQAIEYMDQNKVTFNQLPQTLRDAVPTDKWGAADSAGKNLAENKTNLVLYNTLAADPTKDPQTGKPLSDEGFMKYRAELSESDFKHFSNERSKKSGATPGSNGPGDLNTGAIKASLDNSLNQLGIDPSPKSDGGTDAARVGSIRKFVDTYFYTAQREAGKKFTDAEVSDHLTALFMKNQTIKNFMSKDYSGALLGMQTSDLPSGTLKEIKAGLKQSGVGNPTDAQIIEHYWQTQVSR